MTIIIFHLPDIKGRTTISEDTSKRLFKFVLNNFPKKPPNFLKIPYICATVFKTSHCPGAEIGRQAWLRAMCPYGRAGSSPALGTSVTNL